MESLGKERIKEKKMYQLAVFDLDGTLLNTISDLSTACNVALETFGYPSHDEETYKTYVGNGIYKLVERSLPEAARDRENVLRVKEVFDTYYKAHSLDQTKPYEGIIQLLKNLKKQGVSCGVVTNKAHPYAVDLVKLFFGDLNQYTLGQREGVPTKPNPQAVLEMMAYFNETNTACIYIGDSDVDIQTAQAAQLESVGVLWGFRSKEELTKAGATYLVENTEQLEQIIMDKRK